ncbi:MAG: ABC transporter permease subunit [Clostridiales bacterium]|jgi:putative aldouronate transport system permease protein|nr:ABC transporter permease subunit [Clostridiales bacterium]
MADGSKTIWKRQIPLFLMIVPGCLYLIVNNYAPMFGVFIAFKNIDYAKGIFKSDWVGFSNFTYLFKTADAFVITRNTVLYNLAFIVIGTVTGIAVGIMLSELRGSVKLKFYQTVLLLPYLLSWVIVAYIGYAFMSSDIGLLNNAILPALGLKPISWYADYKVWPFILTAVNLWKGIGYSSVLYLSTIIGIDKNLYEAAQIDGASKWRQIKNITLPMLKPMVIMLVILNVGRIFNSDFGLFYQLPMNSGALYPTTQTIDTYVYRGLMQLNDVSMSAAAGLYQSVVGFVMVIAANAFVRKVSSENVLF